jgi:hypothetical protein
LGISIDVDAAAAAGAVSLVDELPHPVDEAGGFELDDAGGVGRVDVASPHDAEEAVDAGTHPPPSDPTAPADEAMTPMNTARSPPTTMAKIRPTTQRIATIRFHGARASSSSTVRSVISA